MTVTLKELSAAYKRAIDTINVVDKLLRRAIAEGGLHRHQVEVLLSFTKKELKNELKIDSFDQSEGQP